MQRFTRTPYYTGLNDPEIGEVGGPIQLGETVIIETVGGHDQDYENNHKHRAGAVMEVKEKRFGTLVPRWSFLFLRVWFHTR